MPQNYLRAALKYVLHNPLFLQYLQTMRLLIVNSNTSSNVTDIIATEARRACEPDTEVETICAPFGVPAIQSRKDIVVAAHGTLEAFRSYNKPVDAGIVACFSDPGLDALREECSFPITGIAEAAFLTACQLGRRFSILAVSSSSIPSIRDLVSHYGLSSRVASIRAVNYGVLEVANDTASARDSLKAEARQAVTTDGAEALVLGGAVTAGMVPDLNQTVPVPVLDGVTCAIRQAELLAKSI